jgi:hypothetical protein
MKKLFALALFLLVFSPLSYLAAQVSESAEVSDSEVIERFVRASIRAGLPRTFAECSGVMLAISDMADAIGQPSLAKHIANVSRGYEAAAWWLLGNADIFSGQEARPYSVWSEYTANLKEVKHTEISAGIESNSAVLDEAGLSEFVSGSMETCNNVSNVQEMIVDMMRDNVHKLPN